MNERQVHLKHIVCPTTLIISIDGNSIFFFIVEIQQRILKNEAMRRNSHPHNQNLIKQINPNQTEDIVLISSGFFHNFFFCFFLLFLSKD